MKMSLSCKSGIAVGYVAFMSVATVGMAFWCEKFIYMGKRRSEKRYVAKRLAQAGEARDGAKTKP